MIVCIASGPSLTREDVVLCESAGVDLAGINNAYQMTDQLKIHYACDTKWWRVHYPYTQAGSFKYSLKAKDKDEGHPGVTQMERGERAGLSHKWPVLNTGGNSGYQAINLLYLLGYKTIVLLGYDMQNTQGQAHWHKDHHFAGSTNPVNNTFSGWRRDFEKMARKVDKIKNLQVINATRITALKCFPQMSLEDALCLAKQ